MTTLEIAIENFSACPVSDQNRVLNLLRQARDNGGCATADGEAFDLAIIVLEEARDFEQK